MKVLTKKQHKTVDKILVHPATPTPTHTHNHTQPHPQPPTPTHTYNHTQQHPPTTTPTHTRPHPHQPVLHKVHDDPLIREERLTHRTLENRDKLPDELWQLHLLIAKGLEVLDGAEVQEAQEVHPVANLCEQEEEEG